MTTKWIEQQEHVALGDKAFLISFSNENSGSTRYILRSQLVYINWSSELYLTGWCGMYSNVAIQGEGAWKVIRIAKSGRYLIEELEGTELAEFLEEMGYPELIP